MSVLSKLFLRGQASHLADLTRQSTGVLPGRPEAHLSIELLYARFLSTPSCNPSRQLSRSPRQVVCMRVECCCSSTFKPLSLHPALRPARTQDQGHQVDSCALCQALSNLQAHAERANSWLQAWHQLANELQQPVRLSWRPLCLAMHASQPSAGLRCCCTGAPRTCCLCHTAAAARRHSCRSSMDGRGARPAAVVSGASSALSRASSGRR